MTTDEKARDLLARIEVISPNELRVNSWWGSFVKDYKDALQTAIKSLEAWGKVRAEIESIRPYFWNSDNELIPKSGEGIVQECLDIIDKHMKGDE